MSCSCSPAGHSFLRAKALAAQLLQMTANYSQQAPPAPSPVQSPPVIPSAGWARPRDLWCFLSLLLYPVRPATLHLHFRTSKGSLHHKPREKRLACGNGGVGEEYSCPSVPGLVPVPYSSLRTCVWTSPVGTLLQASLPSRNSADPRCTTSYVLVAITGQGHQELAVCNQNKPSHQSPAGFLHNICTVVHLKWTYTDQKYINFTLSWHKTIFLQSNL